MDFFGTYTLSPDLILAFNRLVLGVVMLYYGLPKVKDLSKNAEDFVKMGYRPGWFWGTLFTVAEFGGGVMMLAGIFPELFAALYGFCCIVGGTWKKFKVKKDFADYSYDMHLLAMSAVVMAFGGGMFTLVSFTYLNLLQIEFVIAAFVVGIAFAFSSKPERT